MKILLIIFFFVFCHNAMGKTWSNLNATIAVVEYSPVSDPIQNAIEYKNIINNITDTDLNMIIFPECTLTNSAKEAISIEVSSIPCNSSDFPKFMSTLSCTAINKNIWIIVNLDEKSDCFKNQSDCPSKGYYVYNTDVIFDNNGTINARYRKYNLFGESSRNKPDKVEEVTFDAFGLKFGIFTCFDILFKAPAQNLVEKQKIDAAIFPTMWFSELPFLTAVQAQQMWSQAQNTPLFAAGANNPKVGSGGTGVYNGDEGAIDSELLASGGTTFFVSKIIDGQFQKLEDKTADIEQLSKDMDDFFLKTDDSLPDFASELLNTSTVTEEIFQQVCYQKKEFCCNFTISLTPKESPENETLKNYVYHLVAFSDVRSFTGVYNGGIDLCGIIACLNTSLSSCGLRFPKFDEVSWPWTFEKISISAKFENSTEKTQYPNSLLSSIRPLDVSETSWTKNQLDDGFIERTFATTTPQNRLLTFAIYGRDFRFDSAPRSDSGNSVDVFGVNMLLLLASVIFTFLFKN